MSSSGRWTEGKALKYRYDPSLDPGGQGNHYIWEGGTGFGMRLYRTGRRTWVCATTVSDRATGAQRSRFFTLGKIPDMSLKAARVAAGEKLDAMRSGIDPRAAEQTSAEEAKQAAEVAVLAHTTLLKGIEYYVANRNCSPRSKADLVSTLNANLKDLMETHLLAIDTDMLASRYRQALERVKSYGEELDRRYAQLSATARLLVAPPGYYHGIKAALDTIKSFARVYRYWVRMHGNRLRKADIFVPECPTLAMVDDIQPEPQRVKAIPLRNLRILTASYDTYPGSALHPLLARLLLATGRRVGAIMGIRRDYIQTDRIVIPGTSNRTKVRWNKRHLDHMAQVIPLTPDIQTILNELTRVGPGYGDAETWLFPSATSESGHMEEERAAALALREHAGVRFTCHQFRHNLATAAEELGYSLAEIRELLGQGAHPVTQRYIDERVKRQNAQLIAIRQKLDEMMAALDDVQTDARKVEKSTKLASQVAAGPAPVTYRPPPQDGS